LIAPCQTTVGIDQIPADGSEAEWRRCRILAGQVEVGAAVERKIFPISS
jgi:hypothetical protein